MTWWKWSKTPASNASIDGTINWAEGQPPSSVNDSARAMMAALAKGRDDISGSIGTGGTSTAYAVTSAQGFTALQAGLFIAFVPHTTSGAGPTLNADGLGAKPLRSAPGVDLGAGVLIQGTPYVATYFTSNGGEWILHGVYGNPFTVPIGGFMDYLGTTPPNSNFALPGGQPISRTTYATLFALIGTTFGGGDGSTTFNIPDLRGRVTAGLDNMGGVAAGRIGSVITDSGTIVGTTLGSVGGSATHAITQAQLPAVAPIFTGTPVTPTLTTTRFGSAPASNIAGNATNPNTPVPDWNQMAAITLNSITPGGTISNLGSGAAMALLPPTMMVNKIMRII